MNKHKQKHKNEVPRQVFWTSITAILIFIAILVLFKILIPMLIGIIGIFLAGLKLYALIEDVRITFIGGCFYLVVYWYVFNAVAAVFFILIDWINKSWRNAD
jgi:uncharacterized membrane-anchored protein